MYDETGPQSTHRLNGYCDPTLDTVPSRLVTNTNIKVSRGSYDGMWFVSQFLFTGR